jgi:IS5 family transposase
MGFKNIESEIGFAQLAFASSMAKNRYLKTLEQLDKVINWSRIEKILKKYYKIGTSAEGVDAYPPLMLFKCLLLQKWFRIPSDPEL